MTDTLFFTELSPWGLFIASYLFLGGASGGAFCIAALGEFKKEYQPLSKWAALVSVPAIIVGLLFLLADLGEPIRSINVFANVESSVMTWGSIIIVLFTLVGLFYVSFWLRFFPWSNNTRLRKLSAEAGLALALATMIYTGLLLGVAPGRPLWNSPLIPVLFAVSGLSSGIALTAIISILAPIKKLETLHPIDQIHKLDSYVIIAEFIVVASLLASVFVGSFTGSGSVTTILTGQFSLVFWFGLVTLGLIFPLGLQAYSRAKKNNFLSEILMSSFAIAISGFVLRFLIISAGYSIPIPYVANFFDLVQTSSPTLYDYVVTIGLFALLGAVYFGGIVILRSENTLLQMLRKNGHIAIEKTIKKIKK